MPDSRQVVLQIWDTLSDLPNSDGTPQDCDIPCNVMSCLKLNDDKLEWLQIIRSNDIILGMPHNFIQFTTLQEVIAGWLGTGIGTYNQVSDSLHIYEKDLPYLNATFTGTFPKNSDSLYLPKSESDRCFRELFDRLSILVNESLSAKELPTIIDWFDSTPSMRNILCVLSANLPAEEIYLRFLHT